MLIVLVDAGDTNPEIGMYTINTIIYIDKELISDFFQSLKRISDGTTFRVELT